MSKVELIASQKGYRIDEKGNAFSPSGKRLSPAPDSKGYLRFNVFEDGKMRTCWVHRLQAFQKFGEAIYEPGTDVRHFPNPNPDNSIANIQIGTRSQNLRDTPLEKRSDRARRMNRTKHGDLRQKIQDSLNAGRGIRETARELGCSSSAVLAQKKRNQ